MAVVTLRLESNRELLSEAIVEVLASWPELDRQLFAQAHYAGRTVDQIAQSFNLEVREVRRILEDCESRLRIALKSFRDSTPALRGQA